MGTFTNRLITALTIGVAASASGRDATAVAKTSGSVVDPLESTRRARFEAFHRLILPQPGESSWAKVLWLTNLDEARRRAVREGKPLLVWRAGGGAVLGRA